MTAISELMDSLRNQLGWNNARLHCLSQLLFALIRVRSVNLRECAVAFRSKALIDSRYQRLKRFFSGFTFSFDAIARWLFQLYARDQGVYLTIDRTNWQWGQQHINVLTLGIAHEGMAIPLLWTVLPPDTKQGNATASGHQAILQRFVRLFGTGCIQGVLGDREFGSEALFRWCYERNIPFYIRGPLQSKGLSGSCKIYVNHRTSDSVVVSKFD